MTGDCVSGNGIAFGRKITVIDTPGIFDTVAPEDAIRDEINKSINEMVPSPDMVSNDSKGCKVHKKMYGDC